MSDRKEQRAAERFPINTTTSCDFASPVLEDFPTPRVKNVSTDGIGLISSDALAVGLMLVINLANPSKNFSKTLRARVVHCTEQAGGNYLIGGNFVTPLTYDELRILVM